MENILNKIKESDRESGDWGVFILAGMAGYSGSDNDEPQVPEVFNIVGSSIFGVFGGAFGNTIKYIIEREKNTVHSWKIFALSGMGGYCGGKLGSIVSPRSGGIVGSGIGGLVAGKFGMWLFG